MMSSWFADTMGLVTFVVSRSKFAELMGLISFVVSLYVWQHMSLDSDGKDFSRVRIRRAEVNHEKEENQGSVSIIVVTCSSLIRRADFFCAFIRAVLIYSCTNEWHFWCRLNFQYILGIHLCSVALRSARVWRISLSSSL